MLHLLVYGSRHTLYTKEAPRQLGEKATVHPHGRDLKITPRSCVCACVCVSVSGYISEKVGLAEEQVFVLRSCLFFLEMRVVFKMFSLPTQVQNKLSIGCKKKVCLILARSNLGGFFLFFLFILLFLFFTFRNIQCIF